MKVRGVRGATTVAEDSKTAVSEAVVELLSTIFEKNEIQEADLVSIFFTSTPDLTSEFPATAARSLGLVDTPLICAQEINVHGSLPMTIRVLLHAYSQREKGQIEHIYLRGATVLRKDLNK